jgi:peptidoglycan-N-acetylglucosamine deacetylase
MRIDRPPSFVLILWPLIDGILRRCHHMIPLTEGSGAVFAEVIRYNGRSVTLNDGSEIKAGDTIVELHLNNNWFRERHRLNLTTARLARDILLSFAHDLHILAKELDTGRFSNAVALHGCTHIGAITGRLGFQVEELPNSLWKRFARFYISGLAQVYGPRRSQASRSNKSLELKEVWFSKRELLRRYGSTHR